LNLVSLRVADFRIRDSLRSSDSGLVWRSLRSRRVEMTTAEFASP
jgi:hypothetical protein